MRLASTLGQLGRRAASCYVLLPVLLEQGAPQLPAAAMAPKRVVMPSKKPAVEKPAVKKPRKAAVEKKKPSKKPAVKTPAVKKPRKAGAAHHRPGRARSSSLGGAGDPNRVRLAFA